MKAKLVKESLLEFGSQNLQSSFVEMYNQILGNPADFSKFEVEDMTEGGMLEPLEQEWFSNPEISNFGTWSRHSEEEEFGLEWESDGNNQTFDTFEVALENRCNFEEISDRLFYDQENKTGYYLAEGDWVPEYKIWFFAI